MTLDEFQKEVQTLVQNTKQESIVLIQRALEAGHDADTVVFIFNREMAKVTSE